MTAQRMVPAKETQVRFFKALIVGGTAFAVQCLVLWVLKGWFRPLAAFSWAYACSVATHYSLNRFWALRSSRRDTGRQLLEYGGTAAIGYLIQQTVFRFCLTIVGVEVMWANAIAVPPSTLAVFFLLNYRVFRRSS